MTRINPTTLVQRVDDDLVLSDESTGAEVLVPEPRRAAFFQTVLRAVNVERNTPGTDSTATVGPTIRVETDRDRLEVRDLKTGQAVTVPPNDWDALTAALQYLTWNDYDLTDEA